MQDNAGGNKYDTSLCVISFNFIKTKKEYKAEIQRTKKRREGEMGWEGLGIEDRLGEEEGG